MQNLHRSSYLGYCDSRWGYRYPPSYPPAHLASPHSKSFKSGINNRELHTQSVQCGDSSDSENKGSCKTVDGTHTCQCPTCA